MLAVNPIRVANQRNIQYPRFTSAESNSIPTSPKDKSLTTEKVVAGVGVLAGLALLLAVIKTKPISRDAMLEKSGLMIKDNLIYLKQNGEKFSGTLERYTKVFRLGKEIIKVDKGELNEQLVYGFRGREKRAKFFEGNIEYNISGISYGEKKYYPLTKVNRSENKIILTADCVAPKDVSVFDTVRADIKKGICKS